MWTGGHSGVRARPSRLGVVALTGLLSSVAACGSGPATAPPSAGASPLATASAGPASPYPSEVAEGTPPPVMPGTWQVIDLPTDPNAGGNVGDLTEMEDGQFIAVGGIGLRGAVWTSPDLADWTQVTDIPELVEHEAEGLGQLLQTDGALLALGGYGGAFSEPYLTAVWQSVDGQSWRESARVSGFIIDALAVGGGVVGVGSNAGLTWFSGPLAWTSPDGATWTPAPTPEGPASAALLDVLQVADGLMAVGGYGGDFGGDPRQGLVWQSADGAEWTLLPDDPGLADAVLFAALADPSGLIGGGQVSVEPARGLTRPAIWESADGVSWHVAFRTDCCGDLRSLVATGGKTLALFRWYLPSSSQDGEVIVQRERNGTWQVIGQPDLPPGVRLAKLIAVGDQIVGLGYRQAGDSYLPVILLPPST